MSETVKPAPTSPETASPPATANTAPRRGNVANLRPWKPGQSGNPSGRPKIEPRVRKLARAYNRRMLRVLADIAEDAKQPAEQRRKAALAVIECGSGKAPTSQEVIRPEGPLVNVNVGTPMTLQPLDKLSASEATDVYQRLIAGTIAIDAVPAPAALPAPPRAPTEHVDARTAPIEHDNAAKWKELGK